MSLTSSLLDNPVTVERSFVDASGGQQHSLIIEPRHSRFQVEHTADRNGDGTQPVCRCDRGELVDSILIGAPGQTNI
mgnify:CR=1 FL=1